MANATINLLLPLLLVTLLFRPSSSAVQLHRSTKENPANFIGQCLYNHNTLRANLDLPLLQWSTDLADFAKLWLNTLRVTCEMDHSSSDYGENLFWGSGNGWTATDAIRAWAAEGAYYNYGSNSCSPNVDCSHYTQMVWRTTTMVGCAKIRCLTGDTLVACEYAPHGNTIGQRPF